MLGNAFAMSILTTTGFFMLYQKLPRNVRRLIVKYSLITDFVAMVLTYWMFGGTVTALLAGAIVDIMISVMLHVANHPQDFEWLFDAFKGVKELAEKARVAIVELNQEYKAKRAAGIPMFSSEEPSTMSA